ncbi:MAG TPA: LysM domain-containing protein [Dehalococcoidia bacterium]|nr:LysM domain-containing protein [Dehalococcoidia bacterium]
MQCFACENEAIARCGRCGNPFCADHGDDLCAVCADPMQAAPSRSLYRVALFGLFGGAVLALWLMVRPPSVPGEEASVVTQPTETPALTPAGATTAPAEPTATGGEPTVTPLPTEVPTQAATATPTPPPTPTPGPTEYVVQDGDTWFGVAEAFGVDGFTLAEYNGRTLDEYLHPGETLLIPPPAQ